jgi:hypothetical protein
MRQEGLGKFKKSPHGVSNPRSFDLYNSALTTTLPRLVNNSSENSFY